VPSWHVDTRPTVLFYREAVLVVPDVGIVTYHARFSKQQYTLRSVRCRDRTCPMKQILGNQNDTDIPMMADIRK
jgi:hypothetical protein